MHDAAIEGAVPKRAFGRTLADFLIEGATTLHSLHPAEEKLLTCTSRGELCDIAESVPEAANDENRVRSGFLRFLLLGGDDDTPVHEKGVQLNGAFIEGDIDLESAPDARPLRLLRCRIDGRLIGRNARLGMLILGGCHIHGVDCDNVKVAGNVELKDGFTAAGEVSFASAEIVGQLHCEKGIFKNAGGVALDCHYAEIALKVSLTNGFMAEGEVSFSGAAIDADFECTEGTFKNAGGVALRCEDAKITIDVILKHGFIAEGEVNFSGAEITGQFNCEKGTFKNADGVALRCDNVTVAEDVNLSNGFTADGEVRFSGANIRGDFSCTGGSFKNARAVPPDDALSLFGAKIKGTLRIGPGPPNNQQVTIEGSLNLQGARVARFVDDPKSWPTKGTPPRHIHLDGFTYKRLFEGAPTAASIRKKWLLRQSASHLRQSFRTQPFEQLVRVLRDMGQDAEARRIAMFKESLLRSVRFEQASLWYRPFVWLMGWAWGLSCGYGYRPHRLFVTLLVLWLSCAQLYNLAAEKGVFAPADAQFLSNETLARACYANWPNCKSSLCRQEIESKPAVTTCEAVADFLVFNAFTYSAEVILPVVDFKQRSTWTPMLKAFDAEPLAGSVIHFPRWTVRAATWAETVLGALGVILIGAILSGLIKRN